MSDELDNRIAKMLRETLMLASLQTIATLARLSQHTRRLGCKAGVPSRHSIINSRAIRQWGNWGNGHRARVAVFSTLLLIALGNTRVCVANTCPEHLFVIERSKNANIVVYDANRGPGGILTPSKPIVAYWLLNGEKGKREELNLVEWQRAYGFDIKPGSAPGTFAMVFKADRKRRLTIRTLNGCPVVTGPIDGHEGILHRMFVQSNESFIPPKVEYVEFFGEDSETGTPLYEKSIRGK